MQVLAYIISTHLLLLVHLTVVLVDARTVAIRVTSECDIEILQELVASCHQRFGLVSARVDRWHTVEDNDAVCEIGGHDKVVLDDKGSLLGVHYETLDYTSCNDSLFGIEVAAARQKHNKETQRFRRIAHALGSSIR